MPRIWLAIVAILALLSASVSVVAQSSGSVVERHHHCIAAGNQDTGEADVYPLAAPTDLACVMCEATANASLSRPAPVAWRRVPKEEGEFFLHGMSVRPQPFPPKQLRAISDFADSCT